MWPNCSTDWERAWNYSDMPNDFGRLTVWWTKFLCTVELPRLELSNHNFQTSEEPGVTTTESWRKPVTTSISWCPEIFDIPVVEEKERVEDLTKEKRWNLNSRHSQSRWWNQG